jgi:hypothetical protein
VKEKSLSRMGGAESTLKRIEEIIRVKVWRQLTMDVFF